MNAFHGWCITIWFITVDPSECLWGSVIDSCDPRLKSGPVAKSTAGALVPILHTGRQTLGQRQASIMDDTVWHVDKETQPWRIFVFYEWNSVPSFWHLIAISTVSCTCAGEEMVWTLCVLNVFFEHLTKASIFRRNISFRKVRQPCS